jgi:hypothetical protein
MIWFGMHKTHRVLILSLILELPYHFSVRVSFLKFGRWHLVIGTCYKHGGDVENCPFLFQNACVCEKSDMHMTGQNMKTWDGCW